MAQLLLVRHGITDWNKEGKWHGQSNISINDEGRNQAKKDAEVLKQFTIHKVYTSNLVRTKQTFETINQVLNLSVPVINSNALNERDYGIYTGRNKWQVKEEIGEDKFNQLRRSWDYPIPQGESLKQVYERLIPYYKEYIEKDLKDGKNVMIVSSGNTLRALTKYLDNLPDQSISALELNFGEIDVYTIDQNGRVVGKQQLNQNLFQGKH